jgi:multiple sugar transport system substrate-binding protein
MEKKISRRKFMTILGGTGLAVVAAQCTPKTPEAAPTSAPAAAASSASSAAPTAAPAKAQTIDISVICPDRELEKKLSTTYIDLFNAAMEKDSKPWRGKLQAGPSEDSDYHTKLAIDAAAGTLPDVVWVHPTWLPDFAAAGYLLDISNYVKNWPDWEQFYPTVKEQAAFDGKVMAIPQAQTYTLWYRKDVLQKAGISIDQPKTWDDFYKLCEQMVKAGKMPFGLPAATPWGGGTWDEGFRLVFEGFNSKIFNESTKKWVVKSAGLLKTLKVYETLAKNKWLPVDMLLSAKPWDPIKYQGFVKGEIVVATGGDWQWDFDWGPKGSAPIENIFENVDRWLIPSEDGKPFADTGINWSTTINSKTKNPDGAWEFQKFLNSVEVTCKGFESYLAGPASRKDLAAQCKFYQDFANGKMLQAEEFLTKGKYTRQHAGLTKVADGVARATEDVITLKETAEVALDKFAASMTETLGKENVETE